MTEKKTYESKMTDLDAKIKALKQQKKDLKKKHEVEDLKLKVKAQSEQIAQLTADNQALKAKLSETDMETVPFPADGKLKKLEEETTKLKQKLAYNQSRYTVLNNRYCAALRALRSFGSQYGFDPEPTIRSIRSIGADDNEK